MNQLDRAVLYVDGLRGMVDELSYACTELDKVLGEAQNESPYGVADGSVSEEQYEEIRAIYEPLYKLLEAIKKATA